MSEALQKSPEEQLIEDIASFTHDPLGYAYYAFPWGEAGGELEEYNGPRQWQAEALNEIGEHLRNPKTRHQPLLLARASGHGIGKSAFISMIIKWGMDTCEDCKVVVTANTENQLRTKTQPAIICLLQDLVSSEYAQLHFSPTTVKLSCCLDPSWVINSRNHPSKDSTKERYPLLSLLSVFPYIK